ncbi:MAG: RNA-directed DNA polymerase [Spirochaetaceae bacterium]|nr:RNA-directed DNA polymerase [Spirochaetaceae bacterium]
MTSEERHEARYKRRKAGRETKRQNSISQYDDFERIIDADSLYESFRKSLKNVSWKESVQRYEARALSNIAETRRKLITGDNIQKGFVEFTLHERGKIRHIKSVHFSERIVQKCLCDKVLTPILTRSLIHDNGASIRGKGVHFAVRRLIAHLRQVCRNNGYSNAGYALVVDFSKFFDSVRHDILFNLLDNHLASKRVNELVRSFVSVFGDGVSLGLGSQVSQIPAIFFPNIIDHLCKEELRIKNYGRYNDDLYLIHSDKSYLQYCLDKIQEACAGIGITLNNKKTQIVKLKDGVNFLKGKYVLLETGRILRLPGKDSTKRMRRKLKKFKSLIDEGRMNYRNLRESYQSWRGNYRRRFNACNRVRHMDRLYNSLFIKTTTGG